VDGVAAARAGTVADAVAGLDTPAVLVDLDRLEVNLRELAAATASAGVAMRPHVKTHKIPWIAHRQLELGAVGITCATLREAEVMTGAGLDDVLLHYPVVGAAKLRRLAALRDRARVRLVIDSVEVARGLATIASPADPIEVLLDVDTGHHRLGRAPGAPTRDLARAVQAVAGVRVIGVSSHAGHAYAARGPADLAACARAEVEALRETAALLEQDGVPAPAVSIGSTPSVRAALAVPGVTEARPGTYAFNDAAMIRAGVATEETCAVTVAATVVSRPAPDRCVIDAGSKALSSDGVGTPDWIRVLGRPDVHPAFLSEEHGVLTVDPGGRAPAVGDVLLVVPSHVCPVLNLADTVTVLAGGTVVGTLDVEARGYRAEPRRS